LITNKIRFYLLLNSPYLHCVNWLRFTIVTDCDCNYDYDCVLWIKASTTCACKHFFGQHYSYLDSRHQVKLEKADRTCTEMYMYGMYHWNRWQFMFWRGHIFLTKPICSFYILFQQYLRFYLKLHWPIVWFCWIVNNIYYYQYFKTVVINNHCVNDTNDSSVLSKDS